MNLVGESQETVLDSQPTPIAQAMTKEGGSPGRLVGMQNHYSACGVKDPLSPCSKLGFSPCLSLCSFLSYFVNVE